DRADPFLLINEEPHPVEGTILNAVKSAVPLIDAFKETTKTQSFTRLDVTLTDQWQKLNSNSSNETVKSYYSSSGVKVAFLKSRNGFHYVRAKHPKDIGEHQLELLFDNPAPVYTFNDLPDEVKELAAFCRGFREASLDNNDYKQSEDFLSALLTQRSGSCRHRAGVFQHLMQERHPAIATQIIINACHAFIEVSHEGTWVPIDLGGYAANLDIQETLLPEASTLSLTREDPFAHLATDYQHTFSDRGRPAPPDFFERAKNLTVVKFEHLKRPPVLDHVLPLMDTLSLTSCVLTAKALHRLFQCTPNLKTLSIVHCTLSPEEFAQLDLSGLPHLEHVTLNGSFIPSHEALNRLISTTETRPKWVIDSDHLDALPQGIFSNNRGAELTPKEGARVAFKHSSRQLPERYFSSKAPTLDILSSPSQKILIDTDDPETLRLVLQQHCMSNQRPCFFAPNPEALRCGGTFIARDGDKGIISKGPGGALYDVIMSHQEAPFVLLVDYSQFKPADIAAFNSLLDDERTIEGIPLPKHCKIVGLVNSKDPCCYDGADFFSRFDCREHHKNIALPMAVEPALEAMAERDEEIPLHRVIELSASPDWETRLVGGWQLHGQQLQFKEGELVRELRNGVKSFTFNNPPKNDQAFERFLHDLSLHQAIYYRGHKEIDLPADFSAGCTHEASFAKDASLLSFSDERHHSALLLNSATLADFLGKYQEENFGLRLSPGLIETYQGETLALYVTQTLADTDWLKLFECARRYHVHFQLTLAPSVTMPSALMPARAVQSIVLPPSHHTQCIKGPAAFPDDVLIIEVTELEPQDLLPSLQGKFEEESATFHFTEKEGFLLNALKDNQSVVLKGRIPERLAQALQALIYTRLSADETRGRLWLAPEDTDAFSFMTLTEGSVEPLAPTAFCVSASYEERYNEVFSLLKNHPFALLTGATGVGKTHFVTHDWQLRHPNCHYGDDKILEWLEDKRPGLKTLFIDEANLTHKEWSLFEGLFNTPPAIFYQGTYYPLSPEHKVIFAGNPIAYGGERQLPSLFKKHPCSIEFNPLPGEVLVNLLDLKDEKATTAILAVIEGASYITPREIIMMAALTKAAFKSHPATCMADWASYFAYHLAKPHAPTGTLNGQPPQNPAPCIDNIGRLIINKSNQQAVQALREHLNLRRLRLEKDADIPQTGGLGGIILEGEPGIGKSLAVTQCLQAFGLTDEEVCRIPVSLNSKLKEALLIKAFHDGKVVIIDEINSSPMLERVLNALLEGHDLDGLPAKNAGFMIVGTQNPPTFRGRSKTTLPLKHRLETIVMPDYTDEDILHTLKTMVIPNRVARDMLEEFKTHRLKNADLCVRDLLKAANKWLLNQQSVKIPVKPIAQVGSICKTAAVANVVQYRAKREGVKFTPLRSNNRPRHSIRQLAKELGSAQGEILEFARWQALAAKGFDTSVVEFKDSFTRFFDTILGALTKEHLPLIAFALNQNTGLPDPNPHNPNTQEHAAVITGYNAKTDEFALAHWGHIYQVDAVSLFNANQALPATRLTEYYKLNPDFRLDNKAYTPKYVPHQSPSDRKSITPKEGTGFNGKLLVIKDRIAAPNAFFSKKRERDM
ncbi:MAG: hypothetical protein Q8L87_18825, partial [Anaerolineales bacterium]|nr:hypothetical protein [Anaerolineales bacterium]